MMRRRSKIRLFAMKTGVQMGMPRFAHPSLWKTCLRPLLAVALILGVEMATVRADAPSVAIEHAQVVERAISDDLTLYGRVEPDPDAVQTVSLPHAGLITRVLVRLGQRVTQGSALLELRTAPAERMQYQQASNAVEFARRELERQSGLLKQQLATHAQVDNARKALEDARSQLKAIEAQGADQTLKTLTARSDGVVTALSVNRGDRVQADTAALTLADGDHLIAVLGIEPEDLSRLRRGAPVRIRAVFSPQTKVESKVSDIHAMIDPQTGLVQVLAPIPADSAPRFVIGSYLTTAIILDRHQGLSVPRSAVLRDKQGAYVFTVADGKARRVAVTTGIEQDDWIEITQGLKAGEPVVVSGNYELSDGMPVREGN